MSGALKSEHIEKKPDLSLLPLDLLGIVTRAYEYGLVKYFRNNHRKGFETNRCIAAAMRHISDWNDRGQEYDKDAYEVAGMRVHHIGMAIFNLLCVLDSITNHPELVNNYIPDNFVSEVPIEDEKELNRIEKLRTFWLSPPKKELKNE